jgi:hypothetical protein
MFTSAHSQRMIGRFAWVAAWVGLVVGQLHALARHATIDGKEDLDLPLTRLWSDPARNALSPLLDWANPDTVYLTYGKIWLPVFAGFTLCAFVLHRRRGPAGFEKWAWRVALTGYVVAVAGVFCDYYTQFTDYNAFYDVGFVITILGLLITLIGSTLLGIALLRKGFRPRATSWLLTLNIPLAIVILQITSMGSAILPIMFAYAFVGRQIARELPAETAAVPAPTKTFTGGFRSAGTAGSPDGQALAQPQQPRDVTGQRPHLT